MENYNVNISALKHKLVSLNVIFHQTTQLYSVCQCVYNNNFIMFKIRYKDGKHLDHNRKFSYLKKGIKTLREHIENCGNSMIINYFNRYHDKRFNHR